LLKAFRIHLSTPLGTEKRIVMRGDIRFTEEQAVEMFKRQQKLKSKQTGAPYMPAGEIVKVEPIDNPVRPAHLPPSPLDQ
jgi:hypothetical protein